MNLRSTKKTPKKKEDKEEKEEEKELPDDIREWNSHDVSRFVYALGVKWVLGCVLGVCLVCILNCFCVLYWTDRLFQVAAYETDGSVHLCFSGEPC
jgi:hypothetical protein